MKSCILTMPLDEDGGGFTPRVWVRSIHERVQQELARSVWG